LVYKGLIPLPMEEVETQ